MSWSRSSTDSTERRSLTRFSTISSNGSGKAESVDGDSAYESLHGSTYESLNGSNSILDLSSSIASQLSSFATWSRAGGLSSLLSRPHTGSSVSISSKQGGHTAEEHSPFDAPASVKTRPRRSNSESAIAHSSSGTALAAPFRRKPFGSISSNLQDISPEVTLLADSSGSDFLETPRRRRGATVAAPSVEEAKPVRPSSRDAIQPRSSTDAKKSADHSRKASMASVLLSRFSQTPPRTSIPTIVVANAGISANAKPKRAKATNKSAAPTLVKSVSSRPSSAASIEVPTREPIVSAPNMKQRHRKNSSVSSIASDISSPGKGVPYLSPARSTSAVSLVTARNSFESTHVGVAPGSYRSTSRPSTPSSLLGGLSTDSAGSSRTHSPVVRGDSAASSPNTGATFPQHRRSLTSDAVSMMPLPEPMIPLSGSTRSLSRLALEPVHETQSESYLPGPAALSRSQSTSSTKASAPGAGRYRTKRPPLLILTESNNYSRTRTNSSASLSSLGTTKSAHKPSTRIENGDDPSPVDDAFSTGLPPLSPPSHSSSWDSRRIRPSNARMRSAKRFQAIEIGLAKSSAHNTSSHQSLLSSPTCGSFGHRGSISSTLSSSSYSSGQVSPIEHSDEDFLNTPPLSAGTTSTFSISIGSDGTSAGGSGFSSLLTNKRYP